MKNLEQIYYYMGDIAAQIDAIEERIRNPQLPPLKTVGLLSNYSPRELIRFHWSRITVLERCIQHTEERILQDMKGLYDSICVDCKRGIDHTLPETVQFPCEADFEYVARYECMRTALLPKVYNNGS